MIIVKIMTDTPSEWVDIAEDLEIITPDYWKMVSMSKVKKLDKGGKCQYFTFNILKPLPEDPDAGSPPVVEWFID